MKDIGNTTTTIGESAAGEPHPYTDPNSNSGLSAPQILCDPETDGGITISMEASRTYVRSRHNEFQSSYFEGTIVFGSLICLVPPWATLC